MKAIRKVGHKIEAKTKKGPINGDLLIKVVEGRHLSGKDKGDMDPYCIVKIGIQKQKTEPHMKGGTEPHWGDELAFDIKGGDSLMKVKFIVKDKETLLDEKVGRKEIPLPELAELNGKWIQLINKKEEHCGEIRIECKFTGEGLTIPDLREQEMEKNPLMGQQVIRGHNDKHLRDKEPIENEKEPIQKEKEYQDQPATRKVGHQIEKGVTSGPIKGALAINIMEGRDLTGKDFKGKIDPYCQVKIGAQKQKTKPQKEAGATPKWNEKLNFDIKEGNEKTMVTFLVKDKDFLVDDKVGRAEIPLSELQSYDGEWLELMNKKEKNCGAIRIGVKFEGEGWPLQQHGKKDKEHQHLENVGRDDPHQKEQRHLFKEQEKGPHHQRDEPLHQPHEVTKMNDQDKQLQERDHPQHWSDVSAGPSSPIINNQASFNKDNQFDRDQGRDFNKKDNQFDRDQGRDLNKDNQFDRDQFHQGRDHKDRQLDRDRDQFHHQQQQQGRDVEKVAHLDKEPFHRQGGRDINKDNQFHTDQYQGTDKDRLQSQPQQDFSKVFTEPLKETNKDNLPYGCDREFRKHDTQQQTTGKEAFGQNLNKDSSSSQQQGKDFDNVYKKPLEETNFREDVPQMSEGCQQYGQPFGGQQYGQQSGQQFEQQYGMEKPSSYTQQGNQQQTEQQPRKHSYFVQPDSQQQQQQPTAGESSYQD